MPTYHARSITVRLGSMPLTETTTSDIVLKKGEVAKRQCEAAKRKLLQSSLLHEERVLFPGDPEGYELSWLGNAPFMQVQADAGFTQPSGLYDNPQRPATSGNSRPKALALHIKLSDRAFHSGFTGKTHLKIEVLFNGQLSTCSLVHTNDIRSGAKSLHQVFAGHRVDFLAERPWVLLPPFTTADGGMRRFHKTINPSQRWEDLSVALLKEAEERGTDKNGNPPMSAELLHALANMQMPDCVENMQKPGGRKFGVIDVVITAGTGNKLTTGTNYLKSPERLRDSNYTVRAEVESSVENSTIDLSKEETLDLHDAHAGAEGEHDPQGERPCKRQALSSVESLPQHAMQSTDFQGSFSDVQIPFILPSNRSTSQNDLSSIVGRAGPRCPSPGHRSDGHKEPLRPNDRNCTYDAACKIPESQGWNNNASCVFLKYLSPPPSLQSSVPEPLQMHSTSTRIPSSDSVTGHAVFGGSTLANLASGSSPFAQTLSEYSPYFAQPMLPSENDTPTSAIRPYSSTPYVAPTALMLPTATSWPGSSSAIPSPYYQSMHLPQQAQSSLYSLGLASCMPANGLPELLPQMPLFPGSGPFAIPMMPSSPALQMCGPLPPTAMFSVPSKPRRSESPTKDPAVVGRGGSCPSVLISRLVITGLNGRSIVDHRWKIAQRIIANYKRFGKGIADGRLERPSSKYEAPNDRSGARRRSRLRNSSQAKSRTSALTKNLQSDTAEQKMLEKRHSVIKDGQVDQAMNVSLPYLKRHQGPADGALPTNSKVDVPDNIAPFISAPILATATTVLTPTTVQTPAATLSTQPTTSKRRTFLRNALPGIQGPKAATFLLDDPEEVLREAARMKRSMSPTKPATTPCVSSITPPAQIDVTADQETLNSSSPLSSAPSSPRVEAPSKTVGTAGTPPDQIPQLDGSPERMVPATSPRKLQTPSHTKSSIPNLKLQYVASATPQLPVSPDSRKRKASHRSPTKPPRSPNRLKTGGNPPLNDDCVIAFAESVEKDEERGVLRQVKGERQGVFKEDYVVLAVRFFIAGD